MATKTNAELVELLERAWNILVNTPLIVAHLGEEKEYIELIKDIEDAI